MFSDELLSQEIFLAKTSVGNWGDLARLNSVHPQAEYFPLTNGKRARFGLEG